MSISSMTGCGQGQATLHGYLVRVELSAVNRKQLDITLQIPRAYGALESRVQDEVRPKIHRGRIHVAIQVEVSSTRQLHTVHVDEPLADRYVARLRKVAKSMNLPDALSSSDLLRPSRRGHSGICCRQSGPCLGGGEKSFATCAETTHRHAIKRRGESSQGTGESS